MATALTRALLGLLIVLFLLLIPGLGVDRLAIHDLPISATVLINGAWTLIFFLVLVYARVLKLRLRTRAWEYLAIGQVVSVLGMALLLASYLSLPHSLFAARANIVGGKAVLLFTMALSGFFILVEWCRALRIRPAPFSPGTIHFLLVALVLTGVATVLPAVWHPVIEVTASTMLFPSIAGIAIIVFALYLTATSLLVIRDNPAQSHLVWMAVYAVMLVALVIVSMLEAWSLEDVDLQRMLAHTAFYSYAGAVILLIGFVLQTRALRLFTLAVVLKDVSGMRRTATQGPIEEVLSRLLSLFLDVGLVERLLDEMKPDHPSLAEVSIDEEVQQVVLGDLDLSDEGTLADLSSFFHRLVSLLDGAIPPLAKEGYTKERIRKVARKGVTDKLDNLPPGIAGFLMDREDAVVKGVTEALERLLSIVGTDLVGSLVAEELAEAWGSEYVEYIEDGTVIVDITGFAARWPIGDVEEAWLRSYARLCLRQERVIGREQLREALTKRLGPLSSSPLYKVAGVNDLFANAFFSKDHTWGSEGLDDVAGRIDTKFSILVVHGTGFAKELFISRFLGANLAAWRNAIWFSPARASTLRRVLRTEGGIDVDALREGKRLVFCTLDPRTSGKRDIGPGIVSASPELNNMASTLANLFREHPPNATMVVVELPIAALNEEDEDLYKDLYRIKGVCETHRALLMVVVNERTLTGVARTVLEGMCETVARAQGADTLIINALSGERSGEAKID